MRWLRRLLEQEPRNAAAWYWLAQTQDDPQRQRDCLVRALRFQPTHAGARAALEALDLRRSTEQRRPAQVPLSQSVPYPPRVVKQTERPRARSTNQLWFWLGLLTLLAMGVVCLSAIVLTIPLWQPIWLDWSAQLELPAFLSIRGAQLPSAISVGYWMIDVQQPLPQGVYIGDLVLLPEGVFWFGYLRGQYRQADAQTLSLCVDPKEEGAQPTCFQVRITQAQADQVTLAVQWKTAAEERWVEGLIYRKILGDTRRADLASELIGRWQSFPLDHHTRIAQQIGGEALPDDVYLFTASGEFWAGGRKLSSYRVEDGQLRVPDYYGDFGERFQVDRLGDWMALVGQINKPPIILALKRVP